MIWRSVGIRTSCSLSVCRDNYATNPAGSGSTLPGPAGCFLFLLLAALLSCFSPSAVLAASPLFYTGTWGYDQSDRVGQEEFYSQTADLSFVRTVSHAFDYSANVRYNGYWREYRDKRELWAPSANLGLTNDLFQMKLSGSASEEINENAVDYSNQYWEGNFTSVWRKAYVPDLRLNYGQTYSEDDLDIHERDLETEYWSSMVDWDLRLFSVNYIYNNDERTDIVGLTETDTESHFARLDYKETWLQDKLSVAFTQTYNESTFDFTSQTGAPTFQSVPISGVQNAIDSTPINNNDVTLNTTAFPLTVTPGDDQNIIVNVNLTIGFDSVTRLKVYADGNTSISANNPIRWDIYLPDNPTNDPSWNPSNPNPIYSNWTLLNTTAYTISYIPTENAYQIDFNTPVSASYIKIKENQASSPSPTVTLTEIEAYTLVTGTSYINDFEMHKTDFTVSYAFSPAWRFDYALNLEQRSISNSNDYDTASHTGRVNWTPNPYFYSSLQTSVSTRDEEDRPESSNRTYSLSLTYIPLDTLSLNMAASKVDLYSESDKTSEIYTYNFNVDAELFDDLSADMDIFYNTTDTISTGTTSDTFDSRLRFTARLTPELTAELNGSYNKTENITDTETKSADMSMNWRLSDMLSWRVTGEHQWLEDVPDIRAATTSFVVALTEKIQADINYGINDTGRTSENTSLNMRWHINEILSAQAGGSYQILPDEEIWNINVRVTAVIGRN